MENVERPVWRKARAMTKNQVIARAIAAAPSSIQAAMICEIPTRHMRRVKERYQQHGCDRPVDGRGGRPPRKRSCKLYTDRRSHFCPSAKARGPATTEHYGQVSRALEVLGIRQTLTPLTAGTRAQLRDQPSGRAYHTVCGSRAREPSGPSKPARGDCPRNCPWPVSAVPTRPTTTWSNSSSQTSTTPSPSSQPVPPVRSFPWREPIWPWCSARYTPRG